MSEFSGMFFKKCLKKIYNQMEGLGDGRQKRNRNLALDQNCIPVETIAQGSLLRQGSYILT